jgi:hypothetical protein
LSATIFMDGTCSALYTRPPAPCCGVIEEAVGGPVNHACRFIG